MLAMRSTNPARCFYLFSQYHGPLLERVWQALSSRWPEHDFVFINYQFLRPDEELKLQIRVGGHVSEDKTKVKDLLAAIRASVAQILCDRKVLNFSERCESVVASLPGWFNRLQQEEELSPERMNQLINFLNTGSSRLAYHPHNREQDGRIFLYTSLHSFDEAMTYLCGIQDYSYESFIFALRAADRIQK